MVIRTWSWLLLAVASPGWVHGAGSKAPGPTAKISQDLDVMRRDLLDTHVAAAEWRVKDETDGGAYRRLLWPFKAIGNTYKRTMGRYYERNDALRERLPDNVSRKEYDERRIGYIAVAKGKFPGDPIVEAIANANYTDLKALLDKGLKDLGRLHAYFDLAIMMPNEGALSLLIDELNPNSTHSASLLRTMTAGDFTAILSLLVMPHLNSGAFQTFFMAHPPQNPLALLEDVVGQMIAAKPSIFVDYLAACHELAKLDRRVGTGITAIVDKYVKDIEHVLYPQKAALAAVHVNTAVQQSGNYKAVAEEILSKYPIDKKEHVDYLRGLDMIAKKSGILLRMATSAGQKFRPRARFLADLALQMDPQLETIKREALVGLLDLARILELADPVDFAPLLKEPLHKLKPGVLGFVLRTGLVDVEKVKAAKGWFRSTWEDHQIAMVNIVKYIRSLRLPRLPPCTAGNSGIFKIKHIAVGQILTEGLLGRLSYNKVHALIYATLGATYNMPAEIFGCPKSLMRLGPVEQLNARLKCFCGNAWPTVIFEAAPRDGNAAWEAMEKYCAVAAKKLDRGFSVRTGAAKELDRGPIIKIGAEKKAPGKAKDTAKLAPPATKAKTGATTNKGRPSKKPKTGPRINPSSAAKTTRGKEPPKKTKKA